MEMINVKINNMPVSVPKGSTILEAARELGIEIPTLCYMKEKNEIGACRICVVEVKGARTLVTACVHPVAEGMEIYTNNQRVQKAKKMTLQLMLSTHEKNCLSCMRNGNCELQKLCADYGIDDENYLAGESKHYDKDESTLHLVRDNNKCIMCRRCMAACADQHVDVIGANDRGFDVHIGSAFEKSLGDVACVSCGQCIVNCPTGALREKDHCEEVTKALNDPSKTVIVHTAPSIRATLGECFGMPIGTNVEGKMVAALKRLGFDKVFDTNFAADVTIVEEANELIDRVKNGGVLPMITSCSPGWVKFCESYYPELIPHLSTCKSPQQMQGALIKTWYAETHNLDPKDIVSVGIMPCTAKKFEIQRDNQDASGFPDVDISLTTRELGRLIKRAHIEFDKLPNEGFDPAMGVSTGAGTIFGATGGVMEAALRTAVDTLTGEDIGTLDYKDVRGTASCKEAEYEVAGMKIKVAVVSGLKDANKLMKKIKDGTADYQFIEVMCCPGGCVNGGGQPVQPLYVRNFTDLKSLRAKALYDQDSAKTLRKSHDNPVLQKLYKEYLGNPGSEKAHHILHTTYTDRSGK
jgi:NADP-reducing hydrogenase subunit HndD